MSRNKRHEGNQDPDLRAYVLKNLPLLDPSALESNLAPVVQVLGELTPDCVSSVLQSYSDNRVEGLGRLLVHLIWEDRRPQVRSRALTLLSTRSDASLYRSELLRLRGELRDPTSASALIAALGRIASGLPLKMFKPYLRSPDARIRANAVEALAREPKALLKSVFSVMAGDASHRVKAEAALGLYRLGETDTLTTLLTRTTAPRARTSLLHAAGRAHPISETLLAELTRSIHDGTEPEALTAARGLARSAKAQNITKLLGLGMKSPHARVRNELAQAAGRVGGQSAALFTMGLVRRLTRAGAERELATALALAAHLPEVPDADDAVPYLDHPDSRVAANAVELLERHAGREDVRERLARAMGHEHPRVVANCALALWNRGMVRALSRLREMARAGDAALRTSAAWALGRAAGLVAGDLLQELLDDREASVREMAFRSLQYA